MLQLSRLCFCRAGLHGLSVGRQAAHLANGSVCEDVPAGLQSREGCAVCAQRRDRARKHPRGLWLLSSVPAAGLSRQLHSEHVPVHSRSISTGREPVSTSCSLGSPLALQVAELLRRLTQLVAQTLLHPSRSGLQLIYSCVSSAQLHASDSLSRKMPVRASKCSTTASYSIRFPRRSATTLPRLSGCPVRRQVDHLVCLHSCTCE